MFSLDSLASSCSPWAYRLGELVTTLNMSVDAFLTLCTSPVMNLWLVQGVPELCPVIAGIVQHPCDPHWQKIDGWLLCDKALLQSWQA